jgi:hypothetical protein
MGTVTNREGTRPCRYLIAQSVEVYGWVPTGG